MSSIVTSILSSTVGLLWNKARDSTAAKLKDGDVTDAKIREIVVRELNDIKTKLDGLSRKDLLSSYNFLQEGVDFLNVSLQKSNLDQKALTNETHDDRGETSTMPSCGQSGILSEAIKLSQAMGKLKCSSDDDNRIGGIKSMLNKSERVENEIATRKSMGKELTQHPNGLILDEEIFPYIQVISYKTGECKDLLLITITMFTLLYGIQHTRTTIIAINKNNNIIMIKGNNPHVYICDNTGKLQHKFEHNPSVHHLYLRELSILKVSINAGSRGPLLTILLAPETCFARLNKKGHCFQNISTEKINEVEIKCELSQCTGPGFRQISTCYTGLSSQAQVSLNFQRICVFLCWHINKDKLKVELPVAGGPVHIDILLYHSYTRLRLNLIKTTKLCEMAINGPPRMEQISTLSSDRKNIP
ncbi:Hypothetical predicted protein [Paramuricea clavata]|uniref:Uncharacterized protein n=1 Tax=Paramuricea clavata TaxID=317549 RepID=A0A7D9HHE0_PARCT|nr:Hypothetical predicted protein [Paramuricea clavata]